MIIKYPLRNILAILCSLDQNSHFGLGLLTCIYPSLSNIPVLKQFILHFVTFPGWSFHIFVSVLHEKLKMSMMINLHSVIVLWLRSRSSCMLHSGVWVTAITFSAKNLTILMYIHQNSNFRPTFICSLIYNYTWFTYILLFRHLDLHSVTFRCCHFYIPLLPLLHSVTFRELGIYIPSHF